MQISDFSLSSSTRHASSSASIRMCSSSSSIRLASRARRSPSSTFNHARLCSFAFCLASSARRAYSSLLSEPAPLPQLSALPLQRGVPPLQPLTLRAPTPLSVSLQGLGVPPLLPSAARAYPPLLCSWSVMRTYRENALFGDTWIIDMITVVLLHKLT